MSAPIETVLLIDDSDADNFLHRRAIESTDLVGDVVICPDGEAGLAYLHERIQAHRPLPELVLLDINMPRMTGWEFLEAYEAIPAPTRAGTALYVLSGTLNPADHERARQHAVVSGFRSKSLTPEMLSEMIRDLREVEHPDDGTRP
ncbi:MAG: response regulator [Actinomycetota bacterium]